MTLSIGSLFSGIGGLELGMEMTGGFHTLWQAEQNPYALHVLARHWPQAQRFTDVRLINRASVPRVDVLTGGFPCQPHSLAGKRDSSHDDRDLWGEFARIIGEVRPRWVVAENVPGLLSSADPVHSRGAGGFFGRVLRDLAQLGFDAEWHCFPASSVGAHHVRNRVFIVAHPNRERGNGGRARTEQDGRHESTNRSAAPRALAHSDCQGPSGRVVQCGREAEHANAPYSRSETPDWAGGSWKQPSPATFSAVRGVADGFPGRVGRLRCLGNAVVPQQAAVIGRAIQDAEAHFGAFGVMPEQIVQRRHLVAR